MCFKKILKFWYNIFLPYFGTSSFALRSATEKSRVIRFKENGSDPSANSGIALGDNDLYEITGRWNLESFRVIGVEAGKSHVLRVQYYQSPNNT